MLECGGSISAECAGQSHSRGLGRDCCYGEHLAGCRSRDRARGITDIGQHPRDVQKWVMGWAFSESPDERWARTTAAAVAEVEARNDQLLAEFAGRMAARWPELAKVTTPPKLS